MLKSWRAALFAYFKEFEVLPILYSRDETPADVFVVPYGEFLFRSSDCLRGLTPSESRTNLPGSFDRQAGDIRASGKVDAIYIVRMASSNRIDFAKESHISFSNVTTKSLTREQIHQALLEEPIQPCRKHILDILKGNPDDNIEKGVPWIVEEVLYGKQRTSFRTARSLDVASQANFNSQLHGVYAELEATFTEDTMGTVIMVTSQKFPIAWRPAFISQQHYERVSRFSERGFVERCLSWLGAPVETAPTLLRALRNAFPEDLVTTDRISKRMSQGDAIPFDGDNEDHRDYLKNVDLLFAASWESYW